LPKRHYTKLTHSSKIKIIIKKNKIPEIMIRTVITMYSKLNIIINDIIAE